MAEEYRVSPEEDPNQPPFYEELFNGFAEIAAERGTIIDSPLDSSFEPGYDGTATPDGLRAQSYSYIVPGDILSEGLRNLDIPEIKIESYPSVIMGDDIWPEHVCVAIQENIGIEKSFTFSRELEDKSSPINIHVLVEIEQADNLAPVDELSGDQKNEIIADLVNGLEHWVNLNGPEGDFARKFYLILTASDKPSIHDIELLRTLLAELQQL